MAWILGYWLSSLLAVSVLLSLLFIEASRTSTKTTELLPTALTESKPN